MVTIGNSINPIPHGRRSTGDPMRRFPGSACLPISLQACEAVPSSRLFPVFAIIRRTTVYGANK
jgi:hypothetical protein